jgi:hypothetical protein
MERGKGPRHLASTQSRRQWLSRASVAGVAMAAGMTQMIAALAAGAGRQGMVRVTGAVRVNGAGAEPGRPVKPGDVVTTDRGAQAVFVVGADAFLAREDAHIELAGATPSLITVLRVVTGALLSVFQPGEPREIRTRSGLIGIRGTGAYVEVQGERTYTCICYGDGRLVPLDDPQRTELVTTRHHEQPRYILPKGGPRMIERAPVINHTDAELIMLESLVGRTVPFDTSSPYTSRY